MTYEEFKRELYCNLQQQKGIGEGHLLLLEKGAVYEEEGIAHVLRMVNLSDYGKEDALVREDILCMAWEKEQTVRILHWSVRECYEKFRKEGWQSVLPQMVSKIKQLGKKDRLAAMGEYPVNSERLLVRPLNVSGLCGEREQSIFWQFGEIALVLYLLVQREGEHLVTMKLHRDMARTWNMTDETLLTNALLNTCAKLPPRLYYGTDRLPHYKRNYGVFMPGESGIRIGIHPREEGERLRGYCLTTIGRKNGAVAFFYPGVKERLAEILRGDYYVGFTGIHEAMIHPAGHRALHHLKETVFRSNIMSEPGERLTGRVYQYSCRRKELIEV